MTLVSSTWSRGEKKDKKMTILGHLQWKYWGLRSAVERLDRFAVLMCEQAQGRFPQCQAIIFALPSHSSYTLYPCSSQLHMWKYQNGPKAQYLGKRSGMEKRVYLLPVWPIVSSSHRKFINVIKITFEKCHKNIVSPFSEV